VLFAHPPRLLRRWLPDVAYPQQTRVASCFQTAMGKRKKSSRKPGAGKIKLKPLETSFQCLFCHHNESVVCKLDKTEGLGQLHCKVCGQRFSCTVNYLSEPIDVYSEWIDASEKAQEKRAPVRKQRPVAIDEGDEEDERRAPTPLGEEDEWDD